MAKLRIEAEHRYIQDFGGAKSEPIDVINCYIKIYDGENLVAETTLEALVKKFLILSAEYAQVMTAIGAVKAQRDSRIVVAKESDVNNVQKPN